MGETQWEEVRDSELRAGDEVKLWCGVSRVLAIEPYTGPYDFIVGVAKCAAYSFSLERHGWTKRAAVQRPEVQP